MERDRAVDHGILMVAAAVAIVTIVVYLPALGNGFVTWDDNEYVYDNLKIASLDLDFIGRSFTSRQLYMYAPLTTISFGIDYFFWNLRPFGYHLSNLILHALNTFLVVLCIGRILKVADRLERESFFSRIGTLITAGTAGLLFGVHPLHVESVAWISERKDVLYTFFYLLSVLAYIRYATTMTGKSLSYAATAAAFILSLLSKPMAVSLPLVLLILDVYPLNRLTLGRGLASVRSIFLEKLPLFAFSLVFSALSLIPQQNEQTFTKGEFSLAERILTACRAIFFYLQKLLLPTDLSPFYPLFLPASFNVKDLVVFFALAAIGVSCFIFQRSSRGWTIAWVYYMVTVLPVSGIILIGPHAAADRYTYMPLIGPMILIGAGVAYAVGKAAKYSSGYNIVLKLLTVCLLALVIAMITTTERQMTFWKDGVTLWNRVFEIHPENTPTAYRGRAEAYYRAGDFGKAVSDYSAALRIDPGDYRAYSSRGIVYFMSGRSDLALDDFNMTLRIEPGDRRAIYYKGLLCRGSAPGTPSCY